jgi:sulfane dehydrogenase subunit SoxC
LTNVADALTTGPQAFSREELGLAARNHGMPLEALRHDVTPVGLHYLLIHFDIPVVDAATWTLSIGGLVDRELELTLADLHARPAITQPVTLECAGNGRSSFDPRPTSQPWGLEAVGTGEWTGVPLRSILDEAGLDRRATEVVFTGLDRGVDGGTEQQYERSLTVEEAMRDEVILAYALNGVALPPQHGFPLRLLVPGWYGMTSVKWLERITLVDEPFTGYQQAQAYRLRRQADEPGEPITRIEPRSLMAPPGVPEFVSRERFLTAGPVVLEGRAWSGWGPIERVEVSADGGETWADAELGTAPGPWAWRRWTFGWEATPGRHELCTRATDATGRRQPDGARWNLGGYCNTDVQRVTVIVT